MSRGGAAFSPFCIVHAAKHFVLLTQAQSIAPTLNTHSQAHTYLAMAVVTQRNLPGTLQVSENGACVKGGGAVGVAGQREPAVWAPPAVGTIGNGPTAAPAPVSSNSMLPGVMRPAHHQQPRQRNGDGNMQCLPWREGVS